MAEEIASNVNITKRSADYLAFALGKVIGTSSTSRGSNYQENLDKAQQELADSTDDASDSISEFSKKMSQHVTGAKDLTNATKGLERAYISGASGIKGTYEAMKDFKGIIGKSSNSIKNQSAILSGLLESSSLQNDTQDKFNIKMISATKNMGLLQEEWKRYAKENNLAANAQIKTLNQLEETFAQMATNANILDHSLKGVKAAGGDFEAVLKRVNSLTADQLTAEEQHLKKTLIDAGLKDKESSEVQKYIKTARENIKTTQVLAYNNLSAAKAMDKFHEKINEASSYLRGLLNPTTALAAGFTMVMKGITEGYTRYLAVAQTGMIANLGMIETAQYKLAISYDESVKLFAGHTRMLSTLNPARFLTTLDNAEKGMMQFGLSTDQATQANIDFVENTGKAGINLKDNKALTKSIIAQQKAFGELRATTGVTSEEFKSLQEETLNNTDIQSILYGLNQQDRAAKMQEFTDLRQEFTRLGMSVGTAQKAMMTMQELGKQKVTTRFEQSAKLQQALGLAGVGNAAQIADIHRKGTRATPEEKMMEMTAMKQLTAFQDQAATGSYQGEMIANVLGENTEAFKPLMDASREGGLAGEAGKEMTKNQVLQSVMQAKISDEAIKIQKGVQDIKNVMSDPLLKIAGGVLLIAGSLAALGVTFAHSAINKAADFIKEATIKTAANTKQIATLAGKPTAVKKIETVDSDLMKAGGRKGSPNKSKVKGKGSNLSDSIAALAKTSGSECCDNSSSIADAVANSVGDELGTHADDIAEKMSGKKGATVESDMIQKMSGRKGPKDMITGMSQPSSHVVQEAKKVGRLKGAVGAAGKVLGGAKSVVGGGVKMLGGVIGKLGIPGMIASAVFGGVSDAMNAEDILKMGDGEIATIGQRAVVGVAGALKGLTFGFLDEPIDKITQWLAGPDGMGMLTGFGESIMDTLMHGWIETKGALSQGRAFMHTAYTDAKLIFEGLINHVVLIGQSLKQGYMRIFQGIITSISWLTDNKVMRKLLPEGLVDSLVELKNQTDQSVQEGSLAIDTSVKNYSLIRDQMTLGGKERQEVTDKTNEELKAYDMKVATERSLDKTKLDGLEKSQEGDKQTIEAAKKSLTSNVQALESWNALSEVRAVAASTTEVAKPTITNTIEQVQGAVTTPSTTSTTKEAAKTSTSTAKTPLTTEELLTLISNNMIDLLTVNKETKELNAEQLDILESLVSVNEAAMAAHNKRLGSSYGAKNALPEFGRAYVSTLL